MYYPLKIEDSDFTKQGPMQLYSMTHCLQSSLRKRYAWKLENSFIKEKAKDHVSRSKQTLNVNHEIYLVKKQDHLGKHKVKCEAPGRPDAASWTTESQAYLSRVQEQDEQKRQTVAKLIEKFESHKYKEQFLQDISQT